MSYQPKPEQAYTTSGNPATLEPAEQRAASQGLNTSENTEVLGKRIPQEQASEDQAVPTSRGRGVTGAPPGEEAHGKTNEQVGRHNELDAEQMAAPGEGKVYQAVEGWSDEKGKPGASGSQPDLASDLDRKKAEQAPLREKIESQRQTNVDVGGVLGQKGGPANPVD